LTFRRRAPADVAKSLNRKPRQAVAADCCGTKSKAKKDGEKSAHECGMCKMDTAKSQTRIIINLKDKTVIEACCLGCGNHLYNKNLANVESIQIYDYESKQMVDALKASFVIKSKKEPKRSMWPYAIAFADKSKAEAFVAKHQGEITDFNGAVAYIKAEKKAKEDAKEPAKSK
jgi:hypothetical protein